MGKLKTPRGKLVRKFGENIFGNPKYDKLLNRKAYSPGHRDQPPYLASFLIVYVPVP